MGCFDYVSVSDPQFKCSEGHDLSGSEFQTKDLGETMGDSSIDDGVLTYQPGRWGDPEPNPFTGTIEIYTSCQQCPAFVQNKTWNEVATWVEFSVVVKENAIRSVTMTSDPTHVQVATAKTTPYMLDAHGPMTYAEAQAFREERWRLERERRDPTAQP